MQGQSGDRSQEEPEQEDAPTPRPREEEAPARAPTPRRLVRTCVARMADGRAFGPLVAAAAQERGFYQANQRAFWGDGAAYNWGIQRGYFPDFEALTDVRHVRCYVYLAAGAVGTEAAARWSIYVGWLRACGQGRVREVLEALRVWHERIGEPPEQEDLAAKAPRRLVAEALRYLKNNERRMDSPRYRREGLPITSSRVASLVGEFNARVKSQQKYGNRPDGAEALLQLRAGVRSQDDRRARCFAQRPGNPHRRRKAA